MLRAGGHTSTHGRSEAGVCSHGESVKLSEFYQRLLSKVRMDLDLENLGRDLRITENIDEE